MIGSSAAIALLLAVGCGGGASNTNNNDKSGNSNSSQGLSGPYEFVAVSGEPNGETTLIDVNLVPSGANMSASGPNNIQVATYLHKTWYVNGKCAVGQDSTLTGTVSGNNVTFTFSQGQNSFSGQGTLDGTNLSGTYSAKSGSCTDSGTFTGKPVSALSGTFAGTLELPIGIDQVSATLTETQSSALSVQATLSGADSGTFTFSGTAVGNVAYVSGTVDGNPVQFFGYFDKEGTYTGTPNSIACFDDYSLAYEGLLVKQ